MLNFLYSIKACYNKCITILAKLMTNSMSALGRKKPHRCLRPLNVCKGKNVYVMYIKFSVKHDQGPMRHGVFHAWRRCVRKPALILMLTANWILKSSELNCLHCILCMPYPFYSSWNRGNHTGKPTDTTTSSHRWVLSRWCTLCLSVRTTAMSAHCVFSHAFKYNPAIDAYRMHFCSVYPYARLLKSQAFSKWDYSVIQSLKSI